MTTMAEANSGSRAQTPLPQYQCHKKVWALKIMSISRASKPTIAELEEILNSEPAITDEQIVGAIIVPENSLYEAFPVSQAYVLKHNPQEGGYWVQYDDGYTSYSPAKAFEEGYTLITKE